MLKINKTKRMVAGALLGVMFALNMASANEVMVMPDLEGEADLTISYTYDDEKVKLDGAEISLYKIADVDVYLGDVTYTLDEYFAKQLGEDFVIEEMSEELSMEAAKKLSVGDRKANAVTETDADGNAIFKDLDYGIYLVSETAKSGTADKYEYFGNFIVTIPEAEKTERYHAEKAQYEDETEKIRYEKTEFTGKWNYKVMVYPKTETSKIPAPPGTPPSPKTGDDSHLEIFFIIAAVSGICCLVAAGKNKN